MAPRLLVREEAANNEVVKAKVDHWTGSRRREGGGTSTVRKKRGRKERPRCAVPAQMLCRCCGWRGEGRKNQEGGTSKVAGFFFLSHSFLLVTHLPYPFFPFRRASQSLTFFFSPFPRGNRLPHTAKARRGRTGSLFFSHSFPLPPFHPSTPSILFTFFSTIKESVEELISSPVVSWNRRLFNLSRQPSHLHLSSFILSQQRKGFSTL